MRPHWHAKRGRRRYHSLSGKLVLLFLLMAVLFVVLVGSGIRKVFRDHFQDDLRPHLMQYMEYLQHDIGLPPDHQKARQLAERLHIRIYIVDPSGGWSSETNGPWHYDSLSVDHSSHENGTEYSLAKVDGREMFMARLDTTTLLFEIPNLHPEHSRNSLLPILILLLVLAILYHRTQRMIRPIKTLQQGVERFGRGDLDHRAQLHCNDEIGELAESFNAMADDIQQMLEAKRQLLLAISHELRSPLTRAKVSLELLPADAHKAGLARDLDEMEHLIEELLETERLSTRHRILNRQSVELVALLTEVVTGNFAGQSIELALPEGQVTAAVDVPRFKLLVKNLLDNALRHTPEGAPPPVLGLSVGAEELQLRVRDHGEGIAPHHLPHLTEPFYRADPSRRRETGGYGLGLYLCRVIAEAHGGRLDIASGGAGTTVTLTLPRAAPHRPD